MPKAKWSVRGREWHGGSLGEDMAWTVCVYHSTHTPTAHVPNIPVPVYLHVCVRVVQGVRDEEQGRLTSPRANAIHMMICPSNTTLFAEGSRAAADDIPAGSIGSLAGHTA